MNNLFKAIFTFLCLFSINSLSAQEKKTPDVYELIELLPFDNHGWFINQAPLTDLMSANKPKTIIEVGSWLGSSTRFLANLLPVDGIIYAVDHWKGSPEEATQAEQKARLSTLYQRFLSNVIHSKLTNKIVPIRMESLEAAQSINLKADFIYVDAAHDTESVHKDILAWYPHLTKGGVMAGDDWLAPTVQAGVISAAKKLNLNIKNDKQCWWYVSK